MSRSLQETYAPRSICFGCGPANRQGLRIRSMDSGGDITCDWKPADHHEAFPGMLNGGIIGALLDCHCNWTAAYGLMKKQGLERTPCTVTAEYTIRLLRPTPSMKPVHLRARVVEYVRDNRAWVEGELLVDQEVCATCRGLFVAVGEDHPAFHRWG